MERERGERKPSVSDRAVSRRKKKEKRMNGKIRRGRRKRAG